MTTQGRAEPQIGWVWFCKEHPKECTEPSEPYIMRMTPLREKQLYYVDRMVNKLVKPISDQALYDTPEKWTYPTGLKGDCEDYVLLKMWFLRLLGWPKGSLLITVVKDEAGEGHAVLTARTSHGDLILDNKSGILPWWGKRYVFIKRQSDKDQKQWVGFSSPKANTAALPK